MKFSYKLLILALSLVIAVGCCACSSKTTASDRYNGKYDSAADGGYYLESEDVMESAPSMGYDDYKEYDKDYSDNSSSVDVGTTDPVQNDLANRKIIKRVSMTAQTKTYDDFIANLKMLIDANGGFIQNSEMYDQGNYKGSTRRAYITVRIPADRLDQFTSGINSAATVTYYSEDMDDVTLKYVDMESHISSLKLEMEKLMELLSEAASLDYIIIVQDRLTDVRYELESYEAQKRAYDDLIAYSTVVLNVHEVEREVVVEEQGTWEEIGTNLSANIKDIGEGFRRFFIDFMSDLPYIAIWIVVIGVIVIVLVSAVKRRKKKKLQKIQSAKNTEQQ